MEDGQDREADRQSALDLAMDRYADGDDESFAVVFDALTPRLRRLVRLRTRSDAIAEDVVQATLLRIIAARDRWVPGSSVLSYAVVIARRQLIDYIRHRDRERLADDDGRAEELLASTPADLPSAEEALDGRRRDAALRAALSRLPDRWRRPFELVRLVGLSVAEAAEALGMTEGMVKIGAHRAGLALRNADPESLEAP